jgi:sugar phosphate isomerase/epimerase
VLIGIFARTFEGGDADQVLGRIASAGYECTQFNLACCGLPSMPDRLDDAVPAAIAAASVRHAVEIAALSGTYNMVHPDPAVRARGLDRLGLLLGRAREMGTSLITLCTGTRDADDMWRRHPDNDAPDAWRDLLVEMGMAVERAEACGVDLGIEPELANVVSSAEKAVRLLDEIASPNLRVVLDPANLFEAAGDAEREVIIDRSVDLLAGRIALAHAKDRSRDGSFTAAGEGVIDFDRFISRLRLAGFDGPLIAHGLRADQAHSVAAHLRGSMEPSRGQR